MNASKNDLILEELQKITKLLVLNSTKDLSQTEAIETMSKIGFQPKEIAELLGTTANTVRVTLSQRRKQTKR